MKRIVFTLFVLFPVLLNAGIILKKSGDKIENVSIKSVTDTEIIYIAENGVETYVLKNDVSAVLYDDGKYEEFKMTKPKKNTFDSVSETDGEDKESNDKSILDDAVEKSTLRQRIDDKISKEKSIITWGS